MDIDESLQNPPQVYFIYFGQVKEEIPRNITHVTIDPSVRKIRDYAFQDCHLLATVQFHDCVLEIGDSAFQRCRSLTSLAFLPSTLKTIGKSAFSECSRLRDVVLPDGLRSIEFLSFAWCVSLPQISIPSTVETIDTEAFIGCSALTNVQLENMGLLCIGPNAFGKCESLSTIKLPSTLRRLGRGAFNECLALSEIELSRALRAIEQNTFSWCWSLLEISIPKSVQTLENGAFFNCTSLQSVILSEGLISIQRRAFHSCSSLREVHVPSTVSFLGDEVFYKCQSLTNVRLPQYLRSLGDMVFWNCAALGSIVIPETVESIGEEAFFFCSALVDVNFPGHLQTIGTRAFGHCQALSAISLPTSLSMISSRAFVMCSGLLCVEFPQEGMGRVTIGPYCFDGCTALITLSMPPSSIWESTSLVGCDALMDLRFGFESDLIQQQIGRRDLSLRGQFDKLPVHQVCYHSSQTTVQDLERVLVDGSFTTTTMNIEQKNTWKDSYGMTPFHILATSFKPNVEMLDCLFDNYSDSKQCLTLTDSRGLTMMDYLLLHTSRWVFPLIQVVLNRMLVQEMSHWGLERWSMEASFGVDSIVSGGDNETKRSSVKNVLELVGYYLRIEMTSLAELALWKKNIQEVSRELELNQSDDLVLVVEAHRSSCRWQSGVEVVLQNVIEFLWEKKKNDEEEESIGATFAAIAVSAYPLLSL